MLKCKSTQAPHVQKQFYLTLLTTAKRWSRHTEGLFSLNGISHRSLSIWKKSTGREKLDRICVKKTVVGEQIAASNRWPLCCMQVLFQIWFMSLLWFPKELAVHSFGSSVWQLWGPSSTPEPHKAHRSSPQGQPLLQCSHTWCQLN